MVMLLSSISVVSGILSAMVVVGAVPLSSSFSSHNSVNINKIGDTLHDLSRPNWRWRRSLRPTVTVTTVVVATPSKSTASSHSQPTSSSTAVSHPSSGGEEAFLSGHNVLRSQLGATKLTWSSDLEAAARVWADGCAFKHSDSSQHNVGENLAAGTGTFTIADALGVWAAEASQYDPFYPTASHFTQMVWNATTEVGCAVASCDNIFPSSFGTAAYYVCEYFPAGNIIGQFANNVF